MKKKKPLKYLFLVGLTLLGISRIIHAEQTGSVAQQNDSYNNTSNEFVTIASGINGSSLWILTFNGTLTIYGGSLEEAIYSQMKNLKNPLNYSLSSFPWNHTYDIEKIVLEGKVSTGIGDNLFANLPNLNEIEGLENLDISGVESLVGMFSNVPKLKNLDLKTFNTQHIRDMSKMFQDAVGLESLDISSFDMQNVEKISGMFEGVSNLKTIILDETFTFENSDKDKFDIELPDIAQTNNYTGYWQNLGLNGTPSHPRGEFIFNSEDLLKNFDGECVEGTFVWQPNTLYGGADLTAQTIAFGQANATAPLETELEDPFGKKVNVIATLTDDAGAEVQNGHLEKGKYTVTYTGTTQIGQNATVTHTLIVTDPGVPAVKGGDVTVQYVDESGQSISPAAILKGNVGDSITPSQKSISGYTYKSTTWLDTTHKFTAKTQTVKVIYRKNTTPTPVTGGQVTVQYVDTAGKSISSDATLKGNVGDAIKPSQKSISGYTYKSTTWLDTTHKFTAKTQTVKVIYRKNTTSMLVTQRPISVYRLYNKKSMEHLYTKDGNEYNNLPKMSKDWVREGVNFKACSKDDVTTQAVYRVYNPTSGEHLFTTDSNEVKVLTTQCGWKNEGVAWHSPKSGNEVYRLFNPKAGLGAHFVTADANERKVLTTKPNEWKYEGVAWCSMR
ncbi:MucBP domain-containing protein [Lactococcus garvieae]|uniref:MucBP domain-containing protein n=1 Tax=Lactococcus garvieae TaxID=1363 RepID=UPI0038543653